MTRRDARLLVEYLALVAVMALLFAAMLPAHASAPTPAKLIAPASQCDTDSDCAAFCKDLGCDGGPVSAEPKP